MTEWWDTVSTAEKMFWYVTIPFTVIFFLQLILSILGMDHEHDLDGGHGDVGHHDFTHDVSDHDLGDHDHHDHAHSSELIPFQLFTFRNLVVFFTIFGWTGIVATNYGLDFILTLVLAIPAGLFMMTMVAFMFYFAARLTESGREDVRETLLRPATVYLTIPGHRAGPGKVQLEVRGAIREIEALTEGDSLETGSAVRVVEVLDSGTVLVVEDHGV